MTWCENPHCSNPELVCKDLETDIEAAKFLSRKYPDKIFLVRYEDLSLSPFEMTDDIFNFVGLERNKLIEQFLETHTQTTRSGFVSLIDF